MNEDARVTLSDAGEARKAVIFFDMVAAQRRRRSRRVVVRTGGSALAIAALGVSAWAALRFAGTEDAGPVISRTTGTVVDKGQSAPSLPPSLIQIVGNDPSIVDRLRADADHGDVALIDDGELEEYLVRSGRGPGFVRTANRWILAGDIPPPRRPEPGSG